MPEDKNKFDDKKQKKVLKDSDIESYIESDSYGIGLNRFKRDNKVLNELNEKIRNMIVENNKKDKIGLNSMDRAFDMVKDSIGNNFSVSYKNPYEVNYKTSSGMRTLGDLQSQNPEEIKMIDLFEQNIRNSFVQMNEFRIVCKIVPELTKIIKNFTRDILNNNDTHKHFITEVFKSNTNVGKEKGVNIASVNEEIIEKVVKRNDLERKIKKYIEEALMMGAKPIAVIPYSDIKEMITEKLVQTKESLESFYNRIDENSMYRPSLVEKFMNKKRNSKYTTEGEDDDIFDKSSENIELYKYIIGNSVEELYSLESTSYLNSLEAIPIEDEKKKQENEEIRKKFLDADSDIVKAKKKEIHEEVAKIINTIDQNVEIVDPTSTALSLAKKALKGGWKLKYLHEDENYININADFERRLDPKYSTINGDEYENIDKNKEKPTSSKDKNNKNVDKSLDDVLILDFDPENVIPIIVNGIHVDYYVIEDEAYDAGIGRNRKFSFTFMDIIKSLGVGNDDSLLGIGGVQNVASDGMGYHNIPTFGSQINISTLSSSVTQNMQSQDALKRNEILRDVILRTISSKLENKDLIDNKIFRDAIMNLFRQGFILKKKVQFTNIPAGNMVYFAHNLSNNGLPASIYADTLFYCYIYISSLISSLMIKLAKSSNKDKVKFEVANDNNFALAAHMVEHGMSTRQTHGFNTFDGIMNVLKNSVAHDRILIPLVDGNSMFEYEQMEQMNDINIDDEFTEKMLYKIIQQTSFPAAAMNKLSEEEYARSIAAQQLAYVDDLIEKQEIFGSQVTKLLKLCMRYTKFTETTKKVIDENINDVDFSFAIPSKLFVENNTELFNSIESYADMIVKIFWGSKADEEPYKEAVNLFRKKIIQISATNIDWKDYENTYKECLAAKPELDLKNIKDQKIFEETQEKAIDTSSGGDDFGGSDFGGGDDFGSTDDMGGSEGGDDFGMPNMEEEDENIEF